MKKFFKFILVLIIIAAAAFAYDAYSGFQLTERVSEMILFRENTEDAGESETEKSDIQNDLNHMLYSSLSADEKEIYDSIYDALINFKSAVFLKNSPDSERVFEIMQIVLSEHPEIFWTKGDCSYSPAGIITPKYFYEKSEAQEKSKLIDKTVENILSGVSGDEYTKSLSLFEYIVGSTEYDRANQNNLESVPAVSTIEGVFLNNKAVCTGYAKAYQYLLHKSGLQAICVTGDADSGSGSFGHAWIYQQINNRRYFSDPTWSDGYSAQNNKSVVNHDFFCVTAKELENTHFLGNEFKGLTASDKEYNYFVRENRYFDQYSLSSIKKIAKNDLAENKRATEIKFSNQQAYENAKNSLFVGEDVYSVLRYADPIGSKISTDHISYNSNDEMKTVILIYTYNN